MSLRQGVVSLERKSYLLVINIYGILAMMRHFGVEYLYDEYQPLRRHLK